MAKPNRAVSHTDLTTLLRHKENCVLRTLDNLDNLGRLRDQRWRAGYERWLWSQLELLRQEMQVEKKRTRDARRSIKKG